MTYANLINSLRAAGNLAGFARNNKDRGLYDTAIKDIDSITAKIRDAYPSKCWSDNDPKYIAMLELCRLQKKEK